jgi:excisionase family DNA binding protein
MPNQSQDEQKGTPIMTVKDVAEYLRFSEAKVYKMARAGEVPAARIGKEWRFRRDLLDEWIQKESGECSE